MMSPNDHSPALPDGAARPSGGLFRFWAQALQRLGANHFAPSGIPHRGLSAVKHSATRRSVILVGDAPLFQGRAKAFAWLGATEHPVKKSIKRFFLLGNLILGKSGIPPCHCGRRRETSA